MSIYATLWRLKFPRFGDCHTACEWVEVIAQGVPPHVGSPRPGLGYEHGDPYADFLPPAVKTDKNGDAEHMRAVVIVTQNTKKGTSRNGQEYVDPLLTLDGREYLNLPFHDLHERICDALRGHRPAVIMETLSANGEIKVYFEDGTSRRLNPNKR